MIRLEQSIQLSNEQHVRFEDNNGCRDLHLGGSLYRTSYTNQRFQLIITYDSIWLRQKWFNTQEDAEKYLNNSEKFFRELAKEISDRVYYFKKDLVDKHQVLDERWM